MKKNTENIKIIIIHKKINLNDLFTVLYCLLLEGALYILIELIKMVDATSIIIRTSLLTSVRFPSSSEGTWSSGNSRRELDVIAPRT